MGLTSCGVYGCKSKRGECRILSFPSREEIRSQWLLFTQNPLLPPPENSDYQDRLFRRFGICEKHFARSAYYNEWSNVMHKMAVPTLYPPGQTEELMCAEDIVNSSEDLTCNSKEPELYSSSSTVQSEKSDEPKQLTCNENKVNLCAVLGCRSKMPETKIYPFPIFSSVRSKWLEFAANPQMPSSKVASTHVAFQTYGICTKHFDLSSAQRVHSLAIPMLYPPDKSSMANQLTCAEEMTGSEDVAFNFKKPKLNSLIGANKKKWYTVEDTVNTCAVLGCKSKKSEIQIVPFPVFSSVRAKWLDFAANPQMPPSESSDFRDIAFQSYGICKKHFDRSVTSDMRNKVVPTLYPPDKSSIAKQFAGEQQIFVIRDGEETDCQEIWRLSCESASYVDPMNHGPIPSVEDLIKNGFHTSPPLFYTLVVENPTTMCKDALYGFVFYSFAFSSVKGKYIILDNIFLEEVARNKKVGSALFQNICQVAADNDCNYIHFNVPPSNTAWRFFRKHSCFDLTQSKELHCFIVKTDHINKFKSET